MKSYSRAAEKLYISRQAIGQAIHQLEADLDCTLLVAQNNTVSLTPIGEHLYQKGKHILEEVRLLEQEIRAQTARQTPLRVAIAETLLPHLEPHMLSWLQNFSQNFPGILTEVSEKENMEVLQAVNDDFDFGIFLGEGEPIPGLIKIPYRQKNCSSQSP